MTDYIVTKSRIVEIMTEIPAKIKLFKNIETGRIVGELSVDSCFFGDFSTDSAGLACCPDNSDWREFFNKQFEDFDYSDLIRRK